MAGEFTDVPSWLWWLVVPFFFLVSKFSNYYLTEIKSFSNDLIIYKKNCILYYLQEISFFLSFMSMAIKFRFLFLYILFKPLIIRLFLVTL